MTRIKEIVTPKSTKIILFAGIIVAMILPFSGMMVEVVAVPNENATNKVNSFEPQPETDEDLVKANLREQELNARGIQTVGVNNMMDIDTTPHPTVRGDGPDGKLIPLTPKPGGATDNYRHLEIDIDQQEQSEILLHSKEIHKLHDISFKEDSMIIEIIGTCLV